MVPVQGTVEREMLESQTVARKDATQKAVVTKAVGNHCIDLYLPPAITTREIKTLPLVKPLV
jgi:hypothetical protein